MAQFAGGSAYMMSKEIGDGVLLLSPSMIRKYTPGDLRLLMFEIEKAQRDARAEQPDLDDLNALQRRNRRIQRFSQALLVIRNHVATGNR